MNIAIKKPILISGVSLSFLLWFWQSFSNSLGQWGEFSFWGVILVSGFFFFIRPQKKENNPPVVSFTPITEEVFTETTNQVQSLIDLFIAETADFSCHDSVTSADVFQQQFSLIKSKCDRTTAKVAIVSNHNLNSNDLKNILEKEKNQIAFTTINTSSLDDHKFNQLILNYDLILFLIQGDLTESEKSILEKLAIKRQKIILTFNQTDYHLPEENKDILKQIETRVQGIINPENIVTITTKNQTIKVKKYQNQDQYQEWEETIKPQCDKLTNQLSNTFNNDQENPFITTAYRQTIQLKTNIQLQLNQIRKQKSLPVIEKYQWIAASATFANPVASLDLLAVGAINTQMIIDIGSIYKQKISLSQARQISLELAKLMMKLGIVEISTQTIATILKTNSVTYIAGGVIQGISAAYLTRICSLSLIEYLEQQEINLVHNHNKISLKNIKEKLEKVFKENQQKTFINGFIQQTTRQLGWKTS